MGGGFEPPKASPTDLQSVPFDHSGTPPLLYPWSQRQESNPRPADYKSAALPTELLWLDTVAFLTKVTAIRYIRTHCALKSVYISKPASYVKRFFNFFKLSLSLQSVDAYNKVSARLPGPGKPTCPTEDHPERAQPGFPPFPSDYLLY